jgi:carboxymethylenebutenolidase
MVEVKIVTPRGEMLTYVATQPARDPGRGWWCCTSSGDASGHPPQADWLAGEGYLAVAPDQYWLGRHAPLFAHHRA